MALISDKPFQSRPIRVLFGTPSPFFPDSTGGAEISNLLLLRGLQADGMKIEIVCGKGRPAFTQPISAFWARTGVKLRRRVHEINRSWCFWARPSVDEEAGMPCYRLDGNAFHMTRLFRRRVEAFEPDVVLGQVYGPQEELVLFEAAHRQGIPVFCFVRTADRLIGEKAFSFPSWIGLIANSLYTANILTSTGHKVAAILHPTIDRAAVVASDFQRNFVTIINPVPEKGGAIALEVARRLPHIRFLCVLGRWANTDYSAINFAFKSLPNVTVVPLAEDVREIYARSALILMPSQWLETFGRVILEAHLNGIPVVASDVGAIPFTLGKGGVAVSPKNNIDGYVSAVNQLMSDRVAYATLRNFALENALRPEFDPSQPLKALKTLLLTAIQNAAIENRTKSLEGPGTSMSFALSQI